MLGWWRARREREAQVQAEVERLMQAHAPSKAYMLASQACRDADVGSPEETRAYEVKARVRRLVRPGPDTATRKARDAGRI